MNDIKVKPNSTYPPAVESFVPTRTPAGPAALPQNTDTYVSLSEQTQNGYLYFWEGFLSLIVKIAFVKKFILFFYNFSLKLHQPKYPVKNTPNLLFNSTIEIPTWFTPEMQEETAETLKDQIVLELKLIAETSEANLKTFARLSQIKISQPLFSYPKAIYEIEEALQETLQTLIENMRKEAPNEPLQLHLGADASEALDKRIPLSGLFIKAFVQSLKTKRFPLRLLHVHGPLDNPDALCTLLNGLKECKTLYYLHLNLDEEASKTAFGWIGKCMEKMPSLEFLIFRNIEEKDAALHVAEKSWKELQKAIASHSKLKSVTFYGLPELPKSMKNPKYHTIVQPHTAQGFCIKKTHPINWISKIMPMWWNW